MPSLSAFEDRAVITRRVSRAVDEKRFDSFQQRLDRGFEWAVGALVEDDADRALFIYEDEIWKLPGGGVEQGETREQAVVREVREETGVDIAVDDLLAVTEVTVTDGDRNGTFFFGTYRATPMQAKLTSEPGLEDEAIECVAWNASLPEPCLDSELLQQIW